MIRAWLQRSMPHLATERYYPVHDEVLHLLEARRGRGKSYLLMYFLWCAIKAGVPVWCNFTVDRYRLAIQGFMAGAFESVRVGMEWTHSQIHVMGSWDDLLMSYNGFVLIDEAGRVFDNRYRAAIPQVVTEWAQLSRRSRVTVVLASQSFDWLDIRFRQLADTLWLVRKVQRGPGRDGTRPVPVLFVAYGGDPWRSGLSDNAARDNADRRLEVPFVLRLAQCYDTREPIRVLSGEPRWSRYSQVFDELVGLGRIPRSVAERMRERVTGELGGPLEPLAAKGAASGRG